MNSRPRIETFIFVLLSAFPAAVLAFTLYRPTRTEKRVLFDLVHPEHNGELISVSYSPLAYIIVGVLLVTAIGFVLGLVLLGISIHKRVSRE